MMQASSFEGFRDWLMGILVAAVAGLIGLVRKLDVGEINRRLELLEREVKELGKK